MKKILSSFLIGTLLGSIFSPFISSAQDVNETYFIVTAYYSPLPDQDFYLKGNYEDEIILNGRGISGASGKKVFPGMLAAPKTYSFGTKVYLEGIGIGSIEDRGGAIVSAGERGYMYDRIDIWMGYGDEGLKRALSWGKRKVKGQIVDHNSEVNLDFSHISASPNSLVKAQKASNNIFTKGIGIYSEQEDILLLQKYLSDVGLYSGKIDGVYNSSLIESIYQFQIRNKIVSDKNDYGAGYWGVKTRKLVYEQGKNSTLIKNAKLIKTVSSVPTQEKDIFATYIEPKSSAENIQKLQATLFEMGMYDAPIDGKYNSIQDILIQYQIENKIITSQYDIAAGYFGPKTRESLKSDYIEIQAKKKEEEEFLAKMEIVKEEKMKIAKTKIDTIGYPQYEEVNSQVRELQNMLKLFGYFDYKDTAIFGDITKESLIRYQLERNIVQSKLAIDAGIYGEKTKAMLIKDFSDYLVEKELQENQKLLVIK